MKLIKKPSLYPNLFRYGGKVTTSWLWNFFYTLDLDKLGIYLENPIDIYNFIRKYLSYKSDQENWGIGEHWPHNVQQVEKILLELKSDDCDGLVITYASIRHSAVKKDRHNLLAVASLKSSTPDKVNHLVSLYSEEWPPKPETTYVAECTESFIVGKMHNINEMEKVGLHILGFANCFKECGVHGYWENKI